MLVYICCSGGATSSLFCQKISKEVGDKAFLDHIFLVLKDYENLSQKYDMILAYGPAEFLDEKSMNKYNLFDKLSSVWVAPQMRYVKDKIEEVCRPYDIPVEQIDMRTYGTMNGKKALEDILSKL